MTMISSRISTGRIPWGKEATMTMDIYFGNLNRAFSINKIADAIMKATDVLDLHKAAEFGGEKSAAFREGLVRACNAKMTKCPYCCGELVHIEERQSRCRSCDRILMFPEKDEHLCYVNEEAVAEFVANRIGNRFANRTGDYYHLGEVNGRTLYYGTAPSRGFYSAHKGDNVALVLGRNSAEVPEGWTGHVAYFSELFYVNEACGVIRESANILDALLPRARSPKSAQPRNRQIHNRRSEWLMFIANLLSKERCDDDFYRGSLKPRVARDWFVKNINGAPRDEKQYQRDLRAFRHLDAGEGKPDQREEFIILLLRTAADKRRTIEERRGIAKVIPELVQYLEKGATKNQGRPVNITRGAWQYCRDNTKEYVSVTDVEKFFDKLDERLAQTA